MCVLGRISGHLRRDGKLWTSIYFNDDYVDLNPAHYAIDIPDNLQPQLSSWITGFFHENSTEDMVQGLSKDEFGFVFRVLREINSTRKLLLSEMKTLLETMTSILTQHPAYSSQSRHMIRMR